MFLPLRKNASLVAVAKRARHREREAQKYHLHVRYDTLRNTKAVEDWNTLREIAEHLERLAGLEEGWWRK